MAHKSTFNWSSPVFRHRLIMISLWGAVLLGLILLRSVLLPFVLATLLAYVFHPVVGILERIKINSRPVPKAVSVVLIYLFFVGIAVLICVFFIPQFYLEMVRLAKDITVFVNAIDEDLINHIGQKIEYFFRSYQLPFEIVAPDTGLEKISPAPHKQNWIAIDLMKISRALLNDLLIYTKSETKNIISSAQLVFTKFISTLFLSLLILMITGFLLIDVQRIKRFAFSLVPLTDQSSFDTFLERLDQRLSGVVRGQLTICLVNAILTLIGLLIFQVNFAFILATLAGIFSIVPIFGSIVSTIPIVLVALTQSPITALFSLLWIVGIHILEANFLNPKIMGDSAKIHPVLIILALLAGEKFYGIIGALLAVPIMSIFITIFSSILQKAKLLEQGVAKPVKSDTIPTKEV